jgi:hypothetical protein
VLHEAFDKGGIWRALEGEVGERTDEDALTTQGAASLTPGQTSMPCVPQPDKMLCAAAPAGAMRPHVRARAPGGAHQSTTNPQR